MRLPLLLASLLLVGCSPEALPEDWGQSEPLMLTYGDSFWRFVATREPGQVTIELGQVSWSYPIMMGLVGLALFVSLIGLWKKLSVLSVPLTGALGCFFLIISYFFGNTTSVYSAEGVTIEKCHYFNTLGVVTHIPPTAIRAVEVQSQARAYNDPFERWALVTLVHKDGEHEIIRFVRYDHEYWEVQVDNS